MEPITAEHIAPCGVDCGACSAHLRTRDPCPGCLSPLDESKAPGRNRCRIKTCLQSKGFDATRHATCEKFPCKRMRSLDERYRLQYGTSPADNLRAIGDGGIDAFVGEENTRWTCPHCGERLSMHQEACPGCQRKWRASHK